MTSNNKSNYESVREFHAAFSYPMPSEPTPMDEEMVLNRMGFLGEEMIELLHATSESPKQFREMFKKLLERLEQSYAKQSLKPFPEDKLVAQADACLDMRYFNSGDFTLLGINPDPLFEIVHSCNMKKLFPDGKPRYNEHGKIQKPEGWNPPEPLLEAEIQRQIEEAQK
ncbi:hypothetical protein [Paenibacillus naphthalenovorans]|uniref:Phosphoribosyl-ATP pyrophosphohydrolase n=1 Tax=Paenibacillus naphthalenovorans TaxID=162209 RepID=A0A0U2UG05_9BACL|nr:hypothetical protein [Paenibacillus naphthalenovorans]ALS22108.1 phosphoribosyl-ATP pyrophosphohydrolase [Paenibacillus naphthalenovorans]